jgi:putative endonuclease
MKTVKYLYVYILKCNDNTFYTGVTNNPEKRLNEHNSGINNLCYTYSRRPVELVYCELFNDYNLALNLETKIKKWSKAKKEALIKSNWKKLAEYAACKNETSHKLYNINMTQGLDYARPDKLSVTSSVVEK